MKCRGHRRRWIWFALPLIPALAWAVVLALAPTEWAKLRLVDKLAKATGRSVQIGALRLGVLGDLRILDLSIAEKGSPTSPWLKVGEARMDVHLGQIFCGRCEPKEIEVTGASLRFWRKADGSLEIGELLRDGSTPKKGLLGGSVESQAVIAVKVTDSKVQIVDDPSGTQVELSDVNAEGTASHRLVTLEKLTGKINGGTFAMAAKLDRDPAHPKYEAEVRTNGVEIDRGMPVLGYFVPVVAGATDSIGGKIDLWLALKGHGTTRREVRRSLEGHGSVMLAPVDLEGSKFLAQLDVLGDWPKESKVGTVSTDFTVERERISTDDLTIQVSRFPFVLGGWTDFDGRFDYAARVDQISAKLPREAKGFLSEMKANFDQLAGLRMRGSIDRIDVTVHGQPLTGDPDKPDGERARFRETARRIRDRFFR